MALSALLAPLGRAGANEALARVNALSWATVVVAVGTIGDALLGRAAGIAAAVAVALAPALFELVGSASADALAAAFTVSAVAVETRRRHAGHPVLVLLALAGLCRPEAWLLSALYWLYVARGGPLAEAVRLGCLAAAAPLLWVATDWAVTGERLYSLTITQSGARAIARPTGIEGAEATAGTPHWLMFRRGC